MTTRQLLLTRIGLLVAGASLWPARAGAYPQWQLSSGAVRCDQCHVAPAGGGLLSERGRVIAGDELSTFSGDGELLHGAATLPGWLRIGAYVAGAAQASSVTPQAVFPVEAEAQALLSWAGVSLYGTLAARGQWPGDGDTTVPLQNYQPVAVPWLFSREHWLMWRRRDRGIYLRAGRFFAPFGLHLAEPITYVRRDLGFNELEESYNLSAGYLSDSWELHVTGFAPDYLRHLGSQETGAAAYFERRFRQGAGAFALQGRYATRPGVSRAVGGAVAKYHLAAIRTLLLAEADAVLLSVEGLRGRGQAVGLLGLAVLPIKGVMITALAEHDQEDLAVRGAARRAATLMLGWFPYAHMAAQVMARAEVPAGGAAAKLLFAQLHYFL